MDGAAAHDRARLVDTPSLQLRGEIETAVLSSTRNVELRSAPLRNHAVRTNPLNSCGFRGLAAPLPAQCRGHAGLRAAAPAYHVNLLESHVFKVS